MAWSWLGAGLPTPGGSGPIWAATVVVVVFLGGGGLFVFLAVAAEACWLRRATAVSRHRATRRRPEGVTVLVVEEGPCMVITGGGTV